MKRAIRFLTLVLASVMFLETTAHATTLTDLQNQQQATQQELNKVNQNITNLQKQEQKLQEELEALDDELVAVLTDIEVLEGDIENKEVEIEEAQEAYDAAKAKEEKQYADMKKRIRRMYEDSSYTYLDILGRAHNFADLLNQSTYIEKLSDYDRKMLLQYEAQRQAIEELEARLQAEKVELDGLKADAQTQKGKITESVNKTKNGIAGYENEIAAAEAFADELGNLLTAQEANLKALQKQLEEEIEKSRLAARSKWRDISEVSFTEDDRYLLANLIYAEAGNQPYEGQVAVGAVVINRVLSSVFPNTVSGVIYQHKQFAPVLDGHLALALAQNRATAACYRAADEAMKGYTNVGQCVFFRTPIPGLTGIQIGDHIFY